MRKGLLFTLCVFGFTLVNAQHLNSDFSLKNLPVTAASDENQLRCDSIVAKTPDGKSYDKIMNEFDADGNLIGRTRVIWDDFSETWIPDYRYVYEYDANKNVTLQMSLSWSQSLKDWVYSEKQVSAYNELNKILSMDGYVWGGSDWIPSFQGRATYDERGNQLMDVTFMWDSESSKWMSVVKNEWEYNDRNQITMAAFYANVSGTDQFTPAFKTDYTFDTNGNMTERYMQDWDVDLQKYTSTTKEIFVFDEAGNEIENFFLIKNYDTGELFETTKNEKTYDSRGNMLQKLFYNKDTDNSWVLRNKEEYTYNEMDSVLQKITYSADFMTKELVADFKNEYQYDANGNRTLNINYYWDAMSGSWSNSSKNEWSYNTNSKLIAERKYSYAITDFELMTGDWREDYKADYDYDIYGNRISTVIMVFEVMQNFWYGQSKSENRYDEYGNLLEEKVYQWLDSAEDWKLVGSIVYCYSAPPTGITDMEISSSEVTVRDGVIEISCQEQTAIRIYNVDGRLVSQNQTSVSVRPGCYIVVVGDRKYKVVCPSAF